MILAIVGCKKDDNTSNSNRLQGRWDLTNFTWEQYVDGKLIPPNPASSYGTSTSYLLFEGNKYTVYNKDGEIEEQGTFTLKGDILEVKNYDLTMSTPLKWNGNDEFSMSNRYDVSISKKEYEILTSTYVRHK